MMHNNAFKEVGPRTSPARALMSSQPLTPTDREALRKSRLFRGVDIELVDHLLQDCAVRDLRPGEILLARGEAPSEDVFVVMCGRVSVHLAGAESPSHTVIDAGECVGEMSAIDGEPISATVTALESARLLAIPEPIVWSLVNTSHAVARNLLYILSRRMRHDNDRDRIRYGPAACLNTPRAPMGSRDCTIGADERSVSRQLDRCARDAGRAASSGSTLTPEGVQRSRRSSRGRPADMCGCRRARPAHPARGSAREVRGRRVLPAAAGERTTGPLNVAEHRRGSWLRRWPQDRGTNHHFRGVSSGPPAFSRRAGQRTGLSIGRS